MENTKALAYLYFSQSTAASTLAVTRNRNMLISKMHAFGYDLAGLCCDVENEDKTRPELAKTLENLDNRNFDAICILGVSHINRDPARLLEVIKKLNAHGVKLIDLSCNSELTAANLEMKLAMMAMISYHNAAFEREEAADEMGDDYDYEADELEHLTLESDAMMKYLDFINHNPESHEADRSKDTGLRITLGDQEFAFPLNETTFNAIYDFATNVREEL